MTPLGRRLAVAIERDGPMPVAAWMAACNEAYYAETLFGRDFTTAPEVSQVFGELIGLWAADLWARAGRPMARLVELGPGRGTLMDDALRAAARAGFAPPVDFVETSLALRAEQRARVPGATWHAGLGEVPADAPLIVIANEFLDALPIRQSVRSADGWRARCVGWNGARFVAVAGAPVAPPPGFGDAGEGAIVEDGVAARAVVADIAQRLTAHGGAALIVDYGAGAAGPGSTLQAIRDGAPADPFAAPGDADLTAHVDFTTLATTARAAGVLVHGPLGQGAFLARLGLAERTAALGNARPAAAAGLNAAAARLSDPGEMGTLFQALALTAPGWPAPEGFR